MPSNIHFIGAAGAAVDAARGTPRTNGNPPHVVMTTGGTGQHIDCTCRKTPTRVASELRVPARDAREERLLLLELRNGLQGVLKQYK